MIADCRMTYDGPTGAVLEVVPDTVHSHGVQHGLKPQQLFCTRHVQLNALYLVTLGLLAGGFLHLQQSRVYAMHQTYGLKLTISVNTNAFYTSTGLVITTRYNSHRCTFSGMTHVHKLFQQYVTRISAHCLEWPTCTYIRYYNKMLLTSVHIVWNDPHAHI